MSSIPLYKAFIEVGASEDSAKSGGGCHSSVTARATGEADIASLESRLIKWMVGSLFVFAGIIIAGVGIVI